MPSLGYNVLEKALVIGLGEVGSALYRIISSSGRYKVYGYDIDKRKSIDDIDSIDRPVDYLHITIPYSEDFVKHVKEYVDMFRPRFTYIHSTVAVGTTRRIHEVTRATVAFTPVRGKHPYMDRHMLFWSKWVSTLPEDKLGDCAKHLELVGFRVRIYRGSPESLELAKLWETVYRAIMISSWQELHRIARAFNADLGAVAEFVGEVHEVLRDRPVYFPGYIGGHCLIPNTKILLKQYPSKLLEFVIDSNNRRLTELEDEGVRSEVENVKRIAVRYFNLEYYGEK